MSCGDPALRELTREQCLARLAQASVGRVAVAGSGPVPVIRPVNFRFDERSQAVIFRTHDGSKLGALLRHGQAAFEVDEIDFARRRGWSVIVVGATEEITDATELARLWELGVASWAPQASDRWIRIRARTVTGRVIGSAEHEASEHDG